MKKIVLIIPASMDVMRKKFFGNVKCGVILLIMAGLFSCEMQSSFDEQWMNKSEELFEHNKNKVSISQGIWGTLVKTEGDCMPSIGINNSCRQFPVKGEILVYEYTNFKETKQSLESSIFFVIVNKKLIATTMADKEGFFQLKLNPGQYSIFVRENQMLYANGGDGQGGIMPVTVEMLRVSKINIDMNYNAAY